MSQRPSFFDARTRALAGLIVVIALILGVETIRPVRPSETAGAHAPFADPEPPAENSEVPTPMAEQAQRSITRQEYQATRNDRGLQAPNREHNLRTYFEPWGARIEDRTADGSPELLRMRTVGLGRYGQIATLEVGEVRTDGARVENRRESGVVEWYLNGEAGLEHGYVLEQRPSGDGALRIDVAFDGARVSVANELAVLETGTGRRLEYGKLEVEDAAGRILTARMTAADARTVQLTIDDDGAMYPIVVDPLLTSTADATLQSDQAGSRLGVSVASAGDVNGDGYADVIVGATFYDHGNADEGAAFVFHGGPSGITSGSAGAASATIDSDQTGALLGTSVAGAGDVNGDGYDDVIVGAHHHDGAEGAAFVFHGGPSGVASGGPNSSNAALYAVGQFAFFGSSVAGAGDVNGDGYADVIIGAPTFEAGQSSEGAAFVYHGGPAGIGNGGPATATTTLQSNQSFSWFGFSSDGAGDVNDDGYADVIVGAFDYDAGEADEGAAFVFHGGPSGIPNGNPATANATIQSNQADADLGWSVAGVGDVNGDGFPDVIAGAKAYDSGQTDEGAVFVFHGGFMGVGNGSPSSADSTVQSDQIGAGFGYSVHGVGDSNGDGFADVVVGADKYTAGELEEGAAFVFHGGPFGIQSLGPATSSATLQSDQPGAEMGHSVAGAGDVNGDGFADVIIGAHFFDAGQSDEGAAFVYLGGAEGVRSGNPASANATLQSDQAGAAFGYSVAGAGDLNGDGYSDVIVGAHTYDAGQTSEGAVFVFHGGPGGIASGNVATANATLQSNVNQMQFGQSVAGAGDVNGDGYADIIVGTSLFTDGQQFEGAAFIFHGSPAGITATSPATANAILQSDQFQARLGFSVAGAGDVNGDGFADVIVGADAFDAGQVDEGAAFVFYGSGTGVASGGPTTANSTIQSDQTFAFIGRSVAGAGDVNGDGYSDVIVGAFRYFTGLESGGSAFVFHGGPSGIVGGTPMEADSTLESDREFAWFGFDVAGAGNVNGDGYADVIVGAAYYDGAFEDEGAAFIFHGSSAGILSGSALDADTTVVSGQGQSLLGHCVAGAGDVNGDGFADVIVGAYQYDAGQVDEGAAFIFHGSSTGVANGTPSTASATLQADQQDVLLSYRLSGAGDVNGDGYADVIIGAQGYDSGQIDEGAALVLYGNGDGLGRSVLARQLRGNGDVTSVEPWGSSADTNDFQVRMTATHPEGRGRVKLQVEACPSGENWGGANSVTVTSTTWTDVTATTTGVTLTETVTGLSPFTLYRWRARTLFSPFATATEAAAPAHGPWRRLRGQAVEADIRTGAAALFGSDTVGVYVPSTGSWFLRNDNSPGAADLVFGYGPPGIGWLPLKGDWDGNGTDTAGLYDPVNGNFFLRNTNTGGGADLVYGFGPSGLGWIPLVGDWNGDGVDTVGLYDPVNGNFFLRNAHAPGAADLVYGFGPAGLGWIPLSGDWDGSASDTIGLYDPVNGNFFLRNAHAAGGADLVYGFGPAGLGWNPLAGDWNGDGTDTIGLYDPANGFFFLKDMHAPGPADVVFGYGPANSMPILGDWNGL
ncbi:MAG: FG-GAP repeat protein [Blastocatellia bacterium]|nr:FG-GAP repeat protein [Blastocatellia bacterium]